MYNIIKSQVIQNLNKAKFKYLQPKSNQKTDLRNKSFYIFIII
jgi:hypothetical protein